MALDPKLLPYRRAMLANEVARIDKRRNESLAEIGPPRSYADCDRERFQRRYVIECWEREREQPWRLLCDAMALEERGGLLIQHPVEREHVDAARLAVDTSIKQA